MTEDHSEHKIAIGQLHDSINKTIDRACKESALMTADIVGVLEVIKFNVIVGSPDTSVKEAE